MEEHPIVRLAKVLDEELREEILSPGLEILAAFLNVIYLASLKKEEGHPIQLRVALVDPTRPEVSARRARQPDRWRIHKLRDRLPLTVATLSKLAAAADPWGSALAAYFNSAGELFIWGLIDQAVHFNRTLVHEDSFRSAPLGVCQVVATGSADISVYRKYAFVARLAQESLQRKQIDIFSTGTIRDKLMSGLSAHVSRVMKSLVGQDREPSLEIEVPARWQLFDPDQSAVAEDDDYLATVIEVASNVWFGTLCRILIGIQRYGHGGAFLISSSKSELSLKYAMHYSRLRSAMENLARWALERDNLKEAIWTECVGEAQDVPSHLFKSMEEAGRRAIDFAYETTGCVRFVSSLSRVDGLVFATPDLVVRGFGVEIKTKREVDLLHLASSPYGDAETLTPLGSNHFGTRHRSMMRFCYAHPESVGFVISQDGEIRAMTRVGDRLVVWENPKVMSYAPERASGGTDADYMV